MKIIEAVPNISEARDQENLARILGDLYAVLGNVRLLHVDSNSNANRTVITLAGNPPQVMRVCFMLFQICTNYIDMRFHSGAHPRQGAVDVCPLVPLKGITLEETAVFADGLARQVAEELHVPVYLYEANAADPQRKNLAILRQGGYENLFQKLQDLPPDYGPRNFSPSVARTGASVIGARNFLIAFNMSLNTQDVNVAQKIAENLREKNGGLPGVKAIGWEMPSYGCAQVSCNLTDFHKSNLQDVFEKCKEQAKIHGAEVVGSELIGLVPQEAVLKAGKFYAPQTQDEDTLIHVATQHLLLNNVRPFDPDAQILEKVLAQKLQQAG